MALARALVLNPAVLLLDEPLGALDAKLRKALQIELKALQEEVGITFIYVTHDQEEALTMSDRLAVMMAGRIEQVGSPGRGLRRAVHRVRRRLPGGVQPDVGAWRRRRGKGAPGRLPARAPAVATPAPWDGSRIVIRPERFHLEDHGTPGDNRIPGMVERVLYVGSTIQVIVHLAHGETLQAWLQNRGGDPPFQQGTAVSVHLPPDAIRVLVDETEVAGEEAQAATSGR